MKRTVLILLLTAFAFAWAKDKNGSISIQSTGVTADTYFEMLQKRTAEDAPTPVMLSWVGTGKLGVYTISNAGQNGYYEPPVGWMGYDGQFPFNYTSGNGRTGEFPRGSQQFYVWAAGIWIGGKVQQVVGTDTIIDERVATGAYYSDQGALSPLYQSNQIIPSGFDGEGNFLFKQKGVTEARDFQQLWSYADTSINARRRALGYDELLINPSRGDYLSDEDTYAVWGDYIPEKDARTLFTFGYDTDPLGVRVEQRTYSWSTDAFIYLNYRITNMNDFPIEDVYFGYFMDNDVGDAADDLIGYDANLNLGYSYDSDLKESGWKTLAGYMGTVFVETPKGSDGEELGLTGFQTWTIDGDESDVDNQERDDLKYEQLEKSGYEIFSEPQDVRQLTSSGPLEVLQPGQTVEVTIAVVAGGSLAEIRENTVKAYERYDLGYVGPEPPPSPNLTLQGGDERVIVSWDDFPEEIADPFSGKIDFEGYRVYRSDDGGLSWGQEATDLERYPNGWVPIAEYDIANNETGRFVSTSYFSGTSSASISFEGFTSSVDDYYNESEYTIEILPGRKLFVYNVSQFKSYPYSTSAVSDGEGFVIIDPATGQAQGDETYLSDALISFDGIYVKIKNDTTINDQGQQVISRPGVGDVFKINTFESKEIGDQSGLDYVYVDKNDLLNGFTYTYSVTAFDAGDPTTGLESLESALFANNQNIVPRAPAVDRTLEFVGNLNRVSGNSDGAVSVVQHNPLQMITADFEVEFFNGDSIPSSATHFRIVNTSVDTVVADSIPITGGTAAYSFYGLDLTASAPARASVDATSTGWAEGKSSSNNLVYTTGQPGPYDFEITFTNSLDDDTYSGDGVVLPPTGIAPWTIKNITLDEEVDAYAIPLLVPGNKIVNGSFLRLLRRNYTRLDDNIEFLFNLEDNSDPIQPGDTWTIRTVKPFLNGEMYTFSTQALNELKETDAYSLDEVKVVPNPYYIRARWDTDRFTKHIKFTHLPQKCTIRIFTTSGILINTLEHDEDSGDPMGYHRWTLRNKQNLDISSGLYIYQVKDHRTGKTKLGKFSVVL